MKLTIIFSFILIMFSYSVPQQVRIEMKFYRDGHLMYQTKPRKSYCIHGDNIHFLNLLEGGQIIYDSLYVHLIKDSL